MVSKLDWLANSDTVRLIQRIAGRGSGRGATGAEHRRGSGPARQARRGRRGSSQARQARQRPGAAGTVAARPGPAGPAAAWPVRQGGLRGSGAGTDGLRGPARPPYAQDRSTRRRDSDRRPAAQDATMVELQDTHGGSSQRRTGDGVRIRRARV